MLIKINLHPEGQMLVNPEAIQWVKPVINTVYGDNPNPQRLKRVEFLVKKGANAYEDLVLQAPYSLTDFHALMTLGVPPDAM